MHIIGLPDTKERDAIRLNMVTVLTLFEVTNSMRFQYMRFAD